MTWLRAYSLHGYKMAAHISSHGVWCCIVWVVVCGVLKYYNNHGLPNRNIIIIINGITVNRSK